MSKRPTPDFIKILEQANVPVTEEAMEAKLKEEVVAAGSQLSNDSKMSPFWRWVRSAVVTPSVWLIRTLLAKHVLPNMFVATSARWALELKAWELSVEPKGAVATQGFITFAKASQDDAVIVEKGSVIQTLPIENRMYSLTVLEDVLIPPGELKGKVLTKAEEAGAAYNLPAGYFNILPKELPGIVSAINEPDWITRLGADPETDEELALRLQSAFTSSGNMHIDDAYRSIISNVAGIRSDNVYFRNTGHLIPGTSDSYIVMEVGPTPAKILEQLNKYIMDDGHHGHGDVLTCKAIPETWHDIIADVVLDKNVIADQVAAELEIVKARTRAAFRETAAYPEMTRAAPKSRFSFSLLASEIHSNQEKVDSVKFTVDGEVQKDIVSELAQPRIRTITVRAVL